MKTVSIEKVGGATIVLSKEKNAIVQVKVFSESKDLSVEGTETVVVMNSEKDKDAFRFDFSEVEDKLATTNVYDYLKALVLTGAFSEGMVAEVVGGAVETSKFYTAFLSQGGTGAPTATEVVNTLGITPTFSREMVGRYKFIAPSLIVEGKVIASGNVPDGQINFNKSVFQQDELTFTTRGADDGVSYDDMLNNTISYIKIEILP